MFKEIWSVRSKINGSGNQRKNAPESHQEIRQRLPVDGVCANSTKYVDNPQPIKKKITIQEFCSSPVPMAIQVRNRSQMYFVYQMFDKLGKRWRNGVRYVDENQVLGNYCGCALTNTGTWALAGYASYGEEIYDIIQAGHHYDITEVDFSPLAKKLVGEKEMLR